MLKSKPFIALLCLGSFCAGMLLGLKVVIGPNPETVMERNSRIIHQTEATLRQYEEPWTPEMEREYQVWLAAGKKTATTKPSH